MKTQDLLEKQRKYLWPNHILYYSQPLALDHGRGVDVWDVEGNQYLDFFGGILTTSVGHNHPKVTQRAAQQTEKLIHSSTLYINESHVLLAEKLGQLAPGNLETSFFTSSGTEADETAVMLARAVTGNQDVIVLRHGYSGRSAMAQSMTGIAAWRIGPAQHTGIRHALNPYCYRCPLKMAYPACGVACAEDVAAVIQTMTSGTVAAMLAEPIQGVGGFITPPKEYFKIVAEIVRQHGGLFISDEVQTGFGRTGTHWWGIEHWGVEPDVMTMAKGIANGFPLSNTITTPGIAEQMVGKGLTISTFGGNPVSVAAGLATVEVLETEAPPEKVAQVGTHFRAGLEGLQQKYALIGDVRGMGLMQGLELVKDPVTKAPAVEEINALFEETRRRGLLIGKGGMFANVVRLTPPLTATQEDVARALDILDAAFATL